MKPTFFSRAQTSHRRPTGGTHARIQSTLALLLMALGFTSNAVRAEPAAWAGEWPDTDFSRAAVEFDEILSGGPPRDGIPALMAPRFEVARDVSDIPANEPVIVVDTGSGARAYPLRVLMWHEIVNDVIDEHPVIVTYCPLCNAGVVYDGRVLIDGAERTLTFGVSGKLRRSDMIMYDHQTESWWQQFTGDAIVGTLTGAALIRVTSEMLPFATFVARHPGGLVLAAPSNTRKRYGMNPYVRYDGQTWPFLYDGRYQGPVPPLAYVVAVGEDAWPLERVRELRVLRHGATVIEWHEGMSSALDDERISAGRDIGYVEVSQIAGDRRHPLPHQVTFAFAFKAFVPVGVIHTE